MGITGLLPILSPVTNTIHIKEYANKRVAIDGYCWLHKAVYSCSQELCQGIPTTKYITYCLNLIGMLRNYKVIPVLVFDGGPLPNKLGTELERREKRKQHKERATAFLREGNREEAQKCFQKAVDVTPLMAFNLIKELRRLNIEYIVAPYEADAQLAYLAVTNQVDGVITEDSDLVAYGTPNILFKMDKDGYCKEVKFEDIGSCKNQGCDFVDFSLAMLRHMCILSGCDYLPSLPGLGIKTAYKLVKQHRDIEKIFKYLKGSKGMGQEYIDMFHKADMTFKHQRVFDPISKSVVHFSPLDSPLDPQDTNLDYLGAFIDNDTAFKIATGVIDPNTREIFDPKNTQLPINTFITVKNVQRNTTNPISPSKKLENFTFKANRITQYLNVIATNPTQQSNQQKSNVNKNNTEENDDPFVLDSDIEEEDRGDDDDEFDFDFHHQNPNAKSTLITPTKATLITSKFFSQSQSLSPDDLYNNNSSNNSSGQYSQQRPGGYYYQNDYQDNDYDDNNQINYNSNLNNNKNYNNNNYNTRNDGIQEEDMFTKYMRNTQNSTYKSQPSSSSTTQSSASTSSSSSSYMASQNSKTFKKNSLVTEDRVSINVFDKFIYNKKNSGLMDSFKNNTASNITNNGNINYSKLNQFNSQNNTQNDSQNNNGSNYNQNNQNLNHNELHQSNDNMNNFTKTNKRKDLYEFDQPPTTTTIPPNQYNYSNSTKVNNSNIGTPSGNDYQSSTKKMKQNPSPPLDAKVTTISTTTVTTITTSSMSNPNLHHTKTSSSFYSDQIFDYDDSSINNTSYSSSTKQSPTTIKLSPPLKPIFTSFDKFNQPLVVQQQPDTILQEQVNSEFIVMETPENSDNEQEFENENDGNGYDTNFNYDHQYQQPIIMTTASPPPPSTQAPSSQYPRSQLEQYKSILVPLNKLDNNNNNNNNQREEKQQQQLFIESSPPPLPNILITPKSQISPPSQPPPIQSQSISPPSQSTTNKKSTADILSKYFNGSTNLDRSKMFSFDLKSRLSEKYRNSLENNAN